MPGFTIEPMRREDWAQVRTIYGEGLATGLAAFTTTPPRWEAWNKGTLAIGRLVARGADGRVLGWAALKEVPDT
jgi:phosphinothricin acetyltransferase